MYTVAGPGSARGCKAKTTPGLEKAYTKYVCLRHKMMHTTSCAKRMYSTRPLNQKLLRVLVCTVRGVHTCTSRAGDTVTAVSDNEHSTGSVITREQHARTHMARTVSTEVGSKALLYLLMFLF